MTTMTNPARGRSLLPVGLPRPRLTIVPRVAARAPRVPFVILVVLVLGVGLIGLLLLNTALQRGAYQLSDLKSRSAALDAQQQSLQTQVASLRQPQRVAEAALALGMVRNDSPAFLDLTTGAVTGSATPAAAADKPMVTLRPGVSMPATAKAMPLLAGTAANESTGVERVAGEREGTPADASDRASSPDTRPGSADPHPARDTNNASNTR